MRHLLLQPSHVDGALEPGASSGACRGAGARGGTNDAVGAEHIYKRVWLPPLLQKVQDEGLVDGALAIRARRLQEGGETQTQQTTAGTWNTKIIDTKCLPHTTIK